MDLVTWKVRLSSYRILLVSGVVVAVRQVTFMVVALLAAVVRALGVFDVAALAVVVSVSFVLLVRRAHCCRRFGFRSSSSLLLLLLFMVLKIFRRCEFCVARKRT